MLITIQKRTNITVDDRRAVFAVARNRKVSEVVRESHEAFIGNALRDRMNWPKRDENTPELVTAAKQMAAFITLADLKAAVDRIGSAWNSAQLEDAIKSAQFFLDKMKAEK